MDSHCPRRNRALIEVMGTPFEHSSLRGKAARCRLGQVLRELSSQRCELGVSGSENCGSEEGRCLTSLRTWKATHWAPFIPCSALHARSGVFPWNAEGICWHSLASGLESSGSGRPGGFPGTPSVWLTGLSSGHPGEMGAEGLAFSFFFLLLLKREPFTSTWKTEGLLGMCQAKQKHMVWIYSPKIEQEKGGKWSSLP